MRELAALRGDETVSDSVSASVSDSDSDSDSDSVSASVSASVSDSVSDSMHRLCSSRGRAVLVCGCVFGCRDKQVRTGTGLPLSGTAVGTSPSRKCVVTRLGRPPGVAAMVSPDQQWACNLP